MPDQLTDLDTTGREVVREGSGDDEIVRLTMHRIYPTSADDLWDALTDPARLGRWFARIGGDLRVGGAFEVLDYGTPGTILACEPPRRFQVTYGGETSIVTVSLTSLGQAETELRLEHTVPVAIAQNVAGALFVGPGWDGGFAALAIHLAGAGSGDPTADAASPERMAVLQASIDRWASVAAANGATQDEIEGARAAAMGAFAG
jgi:uncharacterized protein YndB with AHSA1/START domain